ncbi:MAG: acyl-CoA dehydratase activase [Peptococcaceae bacterium]|jgi:predicted CoA-substrate-specific enzyme activase|nr:acyl-CoA dehydratase activase [Peptococcaceae bacterium]
MKATGICIGASTVTRVDVERRHGKDTASVNVVSRTHEGNIRETLVALLPGIDLQPGTRIAVTGRKFKNLLVLSSLSEPEAVENAYAFLKGKYGPADYISCAGGETFTTYQIGATGKITNIFTGNKCASGTGEFFRQQIKRIGIGIEEAVAVQNIDHPYRVSGRCSVFCKSDCTHALNKGEKKDNIVAGLGRMMALRIVEQLGGNVSRRIWLTGGCARNRVMVEYLRRDAPALVIPEEAGYFEALGSALWALEHETVLPESGIFRAESESFAVLPALAGAAGRVFFHDLEPARSGGAGRCILGLDVGSTTTKAVLMAVGDDSIVAHVYIKTLGDPIKAAKACYASLREQTGGRVEIVGLGVTGSGRQIAGLHALTGCVYNEISAHAAAAVHFDPEVDTIFEIGGQDAKYTHIINGVPCDYAMNEACSAGTGSFLEESASEYLSIDVHRIEGVAMAGGSPADFNDQCAAFIGSDIKTAMQENIGTGNIVAGLVYSICKNYLNRVKGNRFVGRKIFMQGGVCYNKAVPIAMAALLDRDVVVPPEPGLMGAYGIALMVREKIRSGSVGEKEFDLDQLIARDADYREPFTCRGGNTGCDRKCLISRIKIEGRTYPFGGICGLYSGIHSRHHGCPGRDDLVRLREEMVYGEFGQARPGSGSVRGRVGISRSLMVNTLFPLYYNFFQGLGFEVVLPGGAPEHAAVKKDSAFCYPVNLAHAYFQDLLGLDPDYLFLPHVKGMPVEGGIPVSLACPLVQGESYYLRTTFDVPHPERILAPVLDFSQGFHRASQSFVETGARLGFDRQRSLAAYRRAVGSQEAFGERCRALGAGFLDELAQTGGKAVVLFGRPYNALVRDGNMGIPEKFTSRGYRVIPYDFLPFAEETPQRKMYWSMGQMILKAAKMVSRHPQLFGVFVTNFSCGPDSFVVGYFRDIMGDKPSLTLELDSHTADAGIDTRIDAFIDVIGNYRGGKAPEDAAGAVAVFDGKRKRIITVGGEMVSLKDPRVRIVVPSMGDLATRHFAAAFRHIGIDAVALDAPAEAELQLGRANSSCKECLPLALTVGSLLRYLGRQGAQGAGPGNGAGPRDTGIVVYFMPEAPDPCRFGQYHVYTENLLRKMGVTNVALLTLSSGNSYGGLGTRYTRRAWQAMVISDVAEDIRSALLALAVDREAAMAVFNRLMEETVEGVAADGWGELKERLDRVAAALAAVPLRQPLADARKVALVGEIYVRRDGFSRQYIVEKLAARGIVVTVAPVEEWIYYCDYTVKNNLSESADLGDKINVVVESFFRRKYEREIKAILARSGLYEYRLIDVDRVIAMAADLISPHILGEAILTIGTSINDIVDHVDGVITIGPFGCMPSRISEAILTERISTHKGRIDRRPLVAEVIAQYPHLPYLNIETDGSAFTQQIEIRLEAFALQVERVNALVRKLKGGTGAGKDRSNAALDQMTAQG